MNKVVYRWIGRVKNRTNNSVINGCIVAAPVFKFFLLYTWKTISIPKTPASKLKRFKHLKNAKVEQGR